MKRILHNGRISRRKFLIVGAIATTASSLGIKGCSQSSKPRGDALLFQLAHSNDNFTFALVADPQISKKNTQSALPATSQIKLIEIVNELNQINPKLPFIVFNGDMVESAQHDEVKNFLHRTQTLSSSAILVHGNHDGHFPYPEFKQMQKASNGTEGTEFSFDCGRWHFITFPCNFKENEDYAAHLLDWLAADLHANQQRPTMVFEHYHLLPQGLTQLAWYTYSKPFKQKLIEQLTTYGNVRYVICGHVHNGIQTSLKTAWTYRGINFITAPTCTGSRNFGEEYPQFQKGMIQNQKDTGGGYYLLIDIQGETAQIRGRLAGVTEDYVYPGQFRTYEDQEPLWFKNVTDYSPNSSLVNSSFEDGLQGWMKPYRYIADANPGYIAQAVAAPTLSGQSAYLFCREKGQAWARDEVMELYQMVQVPAGASPVLTAHYHPEASLKNGGGYMRLCFYQGKQLQLLMLFDWSDGQKGKSVNVSKHSIYTATGKDGTALALDLRGMKKQALFWELPATSGNWHQIQVAPDAFYDQALQQPGEFAKLGIDRVLVAVGVWCLRDDGSQSGAFFDELKLEMQPTPEQALIIDDEAIAVISEVAFHTDFGKERLEEEAT
jgi:3',5'-cyclic AMP phosphodiesterase CpdA